jgi:hypothetical protein
LWDIERLVQDLGGDEYVTRIAVELGDGSKLTVPHAAGLAAVPNGPSRPIASILLESAPPAFLAEGESMSRLAIVQLRDRGSFGLSYHISGEERTVRELATKIEDWVDSIAPWFGRAAFMRAPELLFRGLLALACLVGISLGLSAILGGLLPGSLEGFPASLEIGLRLLAVGSLLLLALGVTWVGVHPRSLFPIAQFQFGEGECRSDRSDRNRALLFRLSGMLAAAGATGSILVGLFR